MTRCRRVAESGRFQNLILGIILFNAVLMENHGRLFWWLNALIQAVFVAEIGVRLLAHGPQTGRFFRDGWNCFDFFIVTLSLLPAAGPFATVARLARLLRVARLVSALPELRLIVNTMLRSIPSMGNVILLLALLLYVYGILGYHLFHKHDPRHWGTLGLSLLTLFQILTLEGWAEIQQATLAAVPGAWIFYGSFIVLAVFVVFNLFIAVVLNNLEQARAEQAAENRARTPQDDALHRVESLKTEIQELERLLRSART